MWWTTWNWGRIFYVYFGLTLVIIFHRRFTIIFILILLSLEGQAEENWEP